MFGLEDTINRTASPKAQANYGTFETQNNGGPVTPNPSQYFPVAGQIDQKVYGRHGEVTYAIIDQEDVSGLLPKLTAYLRSCIGQALKKLKDDRQNILQGVDVDELLPILGSNDDPRIVHYLYTHLCAEPTESAAKGVVSHIMPGSSVVLAAAVVTNIGKLSKAFSKLNSERSKESSSSEDAACGDVLAGLAKHFGVQAGQKVGAEVVKVIPGLGPFLSLTVTLVSSLHRMISGNSSSLAEDLCLLSKSGNMEDRDYAMKAADLLGIPRELLAIKGGEKVVQMRLSTA